MACRLSATGERDQKAPPGVLLLYEHRLCNVYTSAGVQVLETHAAKKSSRSGTLTIVWILRMQHMHRLSARCQQASPCHAREHLYFTNANNASITVLEATQCAEHSWTYEPCLGSIQESCSTRS